MEHMILSELYWNRMVAWLVLAYLAMNAGHVVLSIGSTICVLDAGYKSFKEYTLWEDE